MTGSEQIKELRESIDLRGEAWRRLDRTQRRFLLQQAGAEWVRREEYRLAQLMGREERAKMNSQAGRLAALEWDQVPAEWRGRISSVACRLSIDIDGLK